VNSKEFSYIKMVEITLTPDTTKVSSSKLYLYLAAGVFALAAGVTVWWFFIRKGPPPPPTTTPYTRGTDWTCVDGIKGSVTPVSTCKREGDICRAANKSDMGVCTASPGSASILCKPSTRVDTAKACSDLCLGDEVSDYALYNKNGVCLCRKLDADTLFDRCVLPSQEGWQSCADQTQKDGRLDICDTQSAHTTPGYAWGSPLGGIIEIPNVNIEQCKAEVVQRGNKETYAVHKADTSAANSGTCYVKSRKPPSDLDDFKTSEDPFWDCTYGDPGDETFWGPYTNIDMEYTSDSFKTAPKCLPELKPVKITGNLNKNAWFRPTAGAGHPGDPWIPVRGSLNGPTSTHGCAVACGNIRFRTNVPDNTNFPIDATLNPAAILGFTGFPMSQPMSRWDGKDCYCYDYIADSPADPGPSFFRCAPGPDTNNLNPKAEKQTAWVRTSESDLVSPYPLRDGKKGTTTKTPVTLPDIPMCEDTASASPGDIIRTCDNNDGSHCPSYWSKFISNGKKGGSDYKNCLCLPEAWSNPVTKERVRQLPIWWDLYNADGTAYSDGDACLTNNYMGNVSFYANNPQGNGARCSSYRAVLGNPCNGSDDCQGPGLESRLECRNIDHYYNGDDLLGSFCTCKVNNDQERGAKKYNCGSPDWNAYQP